MSDTAPGGADGPTIPVAAERRAGGAAITVGLGRETRPVGGAATGAGAAGTTGAGAAGTTGAGAAGTTGAASPGGSVSPGGTGQRGRILDAALALVSRHGATGTSMRQLATACGLNVATIYHYFPSKADLLRALIEERRYGERLAADDPPADPALAPRDRLAGLVRWVIARTLEEETVLRLVVGEGLRGDATARRTATELHDALVTAATGWVAAGFPELDARDTPAEAVAEMIRAELLAAILEHLVVGTADSDAHAEAVATAVFG